MLNILKRFLGVFKPRWKTVLISLALVILGRTLYYSLAFVNNFIYQNWNTEVINPADFLKEPVSFTFIGPMWTAFELRQKILMAIHSWFLMYITISIVFSNYTRLVNKGASKLKLITSSVLIYLLVGIILALAGFNTQVRLAKMPTLDKVKVTTTPLSKSCPNPFSHDCLECNGIKILWLCIGETYYAIYYPLP